MNPRSYLYVPGDSAEKLARAGRRGADAVILDLEDAVPFSAKSSARATVRDALRGGVDFGPAQIWVRLNATSLDEDIAAVVGGQLTGVVVPKAEPALVAEADALLTAAEQRQQIAPGSVAVIALVESARGVLAAAEVAAAPRVVRLGIGEADLIGELGLRPGPARAELAGIRTHVVLASAAAGLIPPIGPVQTDLRPDADLVDSTRALLALGFRARTAIHPRQVEPINRVFTPTDDEVEQARRTVAALGTNGVAVDEDQRMIDAAVVRSAYEILSRADSPTPFPRRQE